MVRRQLHEFKVEVLDWRWEVQEEAFATNELVRMFIALVNSQCYLKM